MSNQPPPVSSVSSAASSASPQEANSPIAAPSAAPIATPTGDLAAKAGKYYRYTRYILAAGLLWYGFLSINDGFFKWPRENATAHETAKSLGREDIPLHSDMDLLFNRVLGVLLPPGALLLLGLAVFNSRGSIRLKEETLFVPGHKPVPLPMVESLDKRKWERKGIAWVNYRTENGKQGKLKLDDFVYEREPVDEIFKRIEQWLASPRPVKKVTAIPAAPRVKLPPPPPRPRLGR